MPITTENSMSTPLDKASLDKLKEQTARLSVISNTGLVLMKFVIGFAIGSVSIISEAIHSSMDLIAAVIAFFSVRKSAEPPDAGHSFGHGKFEDISGLIEAILIFVAAILIIREAVTKLLGEPGEHLYPGPAHPWYRRDGGIGPHELVCLEPAHEGGKTDGVHCARKRHRCWWHSQQSALDGLRRRQT